MNDDLQALGKLDAPAPATGNQAPHTSHEEQRSMVEHALRGILAAQDFLKQQDLGPGTPVVVRFPSGLFLKPLGGVEHSGVILTGTSDGKAAILMASSGLHPLTTLVSWENGLAWAPPAATLDWQKINVTDPTYKRVLRAYLLRSWLVKSKFRHYIMVSTTILSLPFAMKGIAEYFVDNYQGRIKILLFLLVTLLGYLLICFTLSVILLHSDGWVDKRIVNQSPTLFKKL